MDKDIALLHKKVDQLTAQMEILARQAETDQRRRQEFDELKGDLIPIGNQLVQLTINELAEIGTEFELEDLLFLLKRVLRNTRLILSMMDRFEALMGIADEVELLGKQVFSTTVETLDRLEREGYFTFARESWGVLEKIITRMDPDDLRTLGDNIDPLIDVLQNITRPEMITDLNRALQAFQMDSKMEERPPSAFALLRELNQSETRRGLARLLNMVRALGDTTQNG